MNDFGLCISTVAEKHNLHFSIFMQIWEFSTKTSDFLDEKPQKFVTNIKDNFAAIRLSQSQSPPPKVLMTCKIFYKLMPLLTFASELPS